ncbi:MAG: hypothetical protein ABH803_02030 [Candidatus Micrarchaeota archaeon]
MKKKMLYQGIFLLGILMLYMGFSQINQYFVTQSTIDTQITVANQLYPEESSQIGNQIKTQFSGPMTTILLIAVLDLFIGAILCGVGYAYYKE